MYTIAVSVVLVAALALFADPTSAARDVAPHTLGEHPRLFFSKADLPALRERVKREPYRSMLQAIKKRSDDLAPDFRGNDHPLSNDVPRDLALLYAVTGDRKYADAAAAQVEQIMDDKQFWQNPGSKGLTRAFGALTVALAYDCCYDAWPESLRKRVSNELMKIANGMVKSMGQGANTQTANNWQGVRYGASGVAYLAADDREGRKRAAECYQLIQRHLKANMGSNGWNPEGIGYTTYPWTFTGPFGIAAHRAGIGDLRADVPATTKTLWTCFVGTVNIRDTNGCGLRADLSDDHPRYSGRGTAGLAFWYTPEAQLPALRWMYDYLPGERGDRTFDTDDGGGIYSLLFYRDDIQPRNPADVSGLTFTDPSHGIAIFRNRYKDEHDIVALVNAHARQPAGCHGGSDTNTFRILGLGGAFVTGSGRTRDPRGQTNLFPDTPSEEADSGLGQLVESRFDEDGSGMAVTTGSCMGVDGHKRTFIADYSGQCGAPALFVNSDTSENGKVWRLNTPEFNEIDIRGNQFTLRSPNGASMQATVIYPKSVTFRTGRFKRGGGVGYPYRGTAYMENKWIEFDCPGQACVVMTLQEGEAPTVKVDHGLHGAQASIGGATIAFERESGTCAIGKTARQMRITERKQPLRPRGLEATVTGDATVSLSWLDEPLGEKILIIERREVPLVLADPPDQHRAKQRDRLDPDQLPSPGQWRAIAEIKRGSASYMDTSASPTTGYEYRLIAANESGRSRPASSGPVVTWDRGYRELIDDFAPNGAGRTLGEWRFRASKGYNYRPSDGRGSPRGAKKEEGFLVTGYVPIRHNNTVFTDGLRLDMSGRCATVSFDVMSQATTRFGLLVRLRDGRWLRSDMPFVHSRHDWQTVQIRLRRTRWYVVDPAKVTGGGDPIEIDDAAFKDVRGIGIWSSWVINRKWARIDQLHVRARPLDN